MKATARVLFLVIVTVALAFPCKVPGQVVDEIRFDMVALEFDLLTRSYVGVTTFEMSMHPNGQISGWPHYDVAPPMKYKTVIVDSQHIVILSHVAVIDYAQAVLLANYNGMASLKAGRWVLTGSGWSTALGYYGGSMSIHLFVGVESAQWGE